MKRRAFLGLLLGVPAAAVVAPSLAREVPPVLGLDLATGADRTVAVLMRPGLVRVPIPRPMRVRWVEDGDQILERPPMLWREFVVSHYSYDGGRTWQAERYVDGTFRGMEPVPSDSWFFGLPMRGTPVRVA